MRDRRMRLALAAVAAALRLRPARLRRRLVIGRETALPAVPTASRWRRDAAGSRPPSRTARQDDSRQRRRAGRVELAGPGARLRCRTSSSSPIRRATSRCRASRQLGSAIAAARGSEARRPPQGPVGAGRPANGALPVHAAPQRRRLRAERVRGRWANDRPGDRSELRAAGCGTAACGSRLRAGASGARRTRSRPNPKWEYLSEQLRDQLDRLDHDRPERLEREHALGRHG